LQFATQLEHTLAVVLKYPSWHTEHLPTVEEQDLQFATLQAVVLVVLAIVVDATVVVDNVVVVAVVVIFWHIPVQTLLVSV